MGDNPPGGISLGSATRTNLLSLQSTQSLIDRTQGRLATGLKVNNALDDALAFFKARNLNSRAGDLGAIKDQIAEMQAAEQARQAELAAQARARLQTAGTTVLDASAGAVVNPPVSYAPPPSKYGGVVGIAMQYLGTPYVYGGASPAGFDCSGFVMYVFAQIGVSLPHNAAAQYGYGMPVSRDQLQPGDLVFFNGLGHDGIYIGGGQFIHSPHTGDVVKISSISGWYASTWVGARRL